jgi:hypothetical protein
MPAEVSTTNRNRSPGGSLGGLFVGGAAPVAAAHVSMKIAKAAQFMD